MKAYLWRSLELSGVNCRGLNSYGKYIFMIPGINFWQSCYIHLWIFPNVWVTMSIIEIEWQPRSLMKLVSIKHLVLCKLASHNRNRRKQAKTLLDTVFKIIMSASSGHPCRVWRAHARGVLVAKFTILYLQIFYPLLLCTFPGDLGTGPGCTGSRILVCSSCGVMTFIQKCVNLISLSVRPHPSSSWGKDHGNTAHKKVINWTHSCLQQNINEVKIPPFLTIVSTL